MGNPDWKVPFVDLTAQFRQHGDEWMGAIRGVAEGGRFIGGEEVAAFEAEFASYSGCKHGVGVASGSDALRLALLALGIGPGDEVATVSHTFVSTTDAIVHAGATPVFVDIDPATFTMDPASLKKVLGPKTKAVLPVHLYGQAADMDPLLELCKERSVPLVEDAAQAHGARYHGRRCGSMGTLSCFSFYPAKNLGALGDAGMVTSNDGELASRIRSLRQYGTTTDKYRHERIGWNSRLDSVQAAVLRRKLPLLDGWNDARRNLARRYRDHLSNIKGFSVPVEAKGRDHVFHVFCTRTKRRERLRAALDAAGIESGIHYPIPVHKQAAYNGVKTRSTALPETESAVNEILSLPLYPELEPRSVDFVCDSIKAAMI